MKKIIQVSIVISLLLNFFILKAQNNNFHINNLSITQSSDKNGNILARISFSYKINGGFIEKVTPKIYVDNIAIPPSYQGGFNGGMLRINEDGTLNLRSEMNDIPSNLSTNTVLPKDIKDGQHVLKVKFEGYYSKYQKKMIIITSNEATISFNVSKVEKNNSIKPPEIVIDKNAEIVTIETNPATSSSYLGVVADEYSSIKIEINTSSATKFCNFNIPNSQGGLYTQPKSEKSNIQELSGIIRLNEGKAIVFYHPPNYIRDENLLSNTKIFASTNETINFLKVPISFSYQNSDGQMKSQTIELEVYRTPIMLVHGFTGNEETWTVFKKKLNKKKYNAFADVFYESDQSGYQSISSQSMHLGELIVNRKKVYQNYGIKLQKVDLICHSMGGLFARNYAHKFPTYNDDVRKLIMVATPNHGIEWYNLKRNIFGILASLIQGQHKTLALEVRSSSPTIEFINKGEDIGTHLNYDVQYGNIYVPTDDLVVSGNSAQLNGVLNYPLSKNLKHSHLTAWADLSSYLPFGMRWEDEVVTESELVFNKIINWLTHTMPPPSFYKDKIDIVDGKGSIKIGDVNANGEYFTKPISNYPQSITSYTPIITGDDARQVTLKFSRDDKEWAQIYIAKNTELFIMNYSPYRVDVNISKGKAKFVGTDGKFSISITPFKDAKEFYNGTRDLTFFPRAVVNDLDTEFVVETDDQSTKVSSINGRILINNGTIQHLNLINSKEAVKVDNFRNIQKSNYNATELISIFGEQNTISKTNPLFANVTTGGSLASINKVIDKSAPSSEKDCLGKLKVQFIVPVGAPSTQQQQFQMKALSDQNNWELRWFQQAEAGFKKGVSPKALSGTYRPSSNKIPGQGKYYSETVTLFKPMKIKEVNGNALGFRLVNGDSHKEQHFSPKEMAKGQTIQCGSYKIYVDPIENIEKTWITITFSDDVSSL